MLLTFLSADAEYPRLQLGKLGHREVSPLPEGQVASSASTKDSHTSIVAPSTRYSAEMICLASTSRPRTMIYTSLCTPGISTADGTFTVLYKCLLSE